MNIWFMLWVFLSVFILGAFFWSLRILIKQKNSWKKFSKRHGLEYQPGGLMSSPTVMGTFRGYGVSVVSEPQLDTDGRTRRYRTVIQVEMKAGMPTEGVIASARMRGIAAQLDLQETFTPENAEWDGGIYLRTKSAELLAPYFTDKRIKAMNALMTINGVNVLFIFNEKDTLMRFETPDPLEDVTRMERLIGKVIDAADILSV